MLRPSGEARELVEVEAGVVLEGVRIIGWLIQAIQTGRRQPIPPALRRYLRRLQPIAQSHQFIHLGNDAVLLGEGWEGENESINILSRNSRNQTSRTLLQCLGKTVRY